MHQTGKHNWKTAKRNPPFFQVDNGINEGDAFCFCYVHTQRVDQNAHSAASDHIQVKMNCKQKKILR